MTANAAMGNPESMGEVALQALVFMRASGLKTPLSKAFFLCSATGKTLGTRLPRSALQRQVPRKRSATGHAGYLYQILSMYESIEALGLSPVASFGTMPSARRDMCLIQGGLVAQSSL